ncbi:MAG: hypothetical protein KC613_26935, partial [Myxococcales bacterium]|nr:hypothetical protein [Myxococcales bacterium]
PTAAMAITPAQPATPAAPRPEPLRPVDPEKGRSTLPPPGKSRRGLIIALVVVLLGGGGFAGWWFGLRTKAADVAPEASPNAEVTPEPPAAWDVRIEQQLEAGQAKLPVVSGPEAMKDGGAWIAGGPEGLQASFGPVAGLPSTLIRDTMVESDGDGEWVGALARRLSGETLPTGQPLAFGLPKEQKVKDLLRLAYAGVKGGVADFVLLVARNSGGLGGLGFTVHRRKDPLEGQVLVVRIGRTTGFHVTVQEAGEVKSAEPRILPRREEDGSLDLRALRERLEELGEAHAGVKTVVIYPLADMTVGELAAVMGELRGTGERPRFPYTRLALR